MHPNDLIQKGIRNARIIRWFDSLSPAGQLDVRSSYASHLECPLCEITEYPIEREDLDFIWDEWREEILQFLGDC